MDKFGVPKKVNRHVLKALYHKYDNGCEDCDFSEICNLVAISMRNNVPVRDLPGAVHQSLQNMAQLGVIGKNGPKFYVQNSIPSPILPKRINPKIFAINDRRERGSKLDPNLRKRHLSDDSLSGNEIKRTQKRLRSVKAVNRKGQYVELPKARIVSTHVKLSADLDQDNNHSEETCEGEEDEWADDANVSSLNTILKNRFFSEISDTEMDQSLSQNNQTDENQTNSEQNQNTNNQEDSVENQNDNDEQNSEQNFKKTSEQIQNTEDDPDPSLTSKSQISSKEVVTAEQKADEIPENETSSENDPQPAVSKVNLFFCPTYVYDIRHTPTAMCSISISFQRCYSFAFYEDNVCITTEIQ